MIIDIGPEAGFPVKVDRKINLLCVLKLFLLFFIQNCFRDINHGLIGQLLFPGNRKKLSVNPDNRRTAHAQMKVRGVLAGHNFKITHEFCFGLRSVFHDVLYKLRIPARIAEQSVAGGRFALRMY